MKWETEIIDCPHCGGKKTLIIDRQFISREGMDKYGVYNWQERCTECEHKDSHYT